MATEKETLVLDLDSKQAVDGVNKLQKSLLGLSKPGNLSGLISSLTKTHAAIIAVGVALVGIKAGIELIKQGEAINLVNKQFDVLAKNAGHAADVLKNDLLKAADGLADDTAVIKAASSALAMMGTNAQRLPEIMELARKQAVIFGGNFLDYFRDMTKSVQTFEMEVLKKVGITIDARAAVAAYAGSVGKMAEEVTRAEKSQAILNAILEQGTRSTKGIVGETGAVTDNLKRLTTVLITIGDALTIFFTRIFQPYFNSGIKLLIEFANRVKDITLATIGSDSEKAAAKLSMLNRELKSNQETLATLEQQIKNDPYTRMFSDAPAQANALRKKIAAINAEIKLAEEKAKQADVVSEERTLSDVEKEDLNKALAFRNKFYQELAALRVKDLDNQLLTATSEEEVITLSEERKAAIVQAFALKIEELRANAQLKKIADEDLAIQIAAAESERNAVLAADFEQLAARKQRALMNLDATAQSVAKRFEAGFKKAALSTARNMTLAGHMGELSLKMLHKTGVSAFQALGQAAAGSAFDLKKVMLSAIGEIAESKGAQLLLESIAELSPIKAAAGAGLVTLGSFLKAKAGGGGSSPPGVSASGGSLAALDQQPEISIPESKTEELQEARKQRDVSVNIMGHYFETPETRKMLTDLIREESDATQFTIAQVGQGA